MRVITLLNTFPPGYTGGAEVSAYHTSKGLLQAGLECSVLVLNNRTPSATDEWYELGNLPVHRVTFRTRRRTPLSDILDVRIYRAVLQELRQLRPDIVHIHNVSGATLSPYLACRAVGVPVVNTLHDLWLLCPNNMLYRPDASFCDPASPARRCSNCFRRYDFWGLIPHRRAIFAALTSNVRVFIAPSRALIRQLTRAGYDERRFRWLPYGFADHPPAPPRHPALRHIATDAREHRTIVFAGGGVEIKGANVLAEAIPLLLRQVERLRILIAGGGEERLLARFRQYAPAVQVLGPLPFDEMRALLRVADLMLVPSVWHENSPVVIYESFQLGNPVVGSEFGGIPELIDHGETGYLFTVGDATALADQVVFHFARPAYERRRMRHRCVEKAHTQLSLEKHITGLLLIYREVTGN